MGGGAAAKVGNDRTCAAVQSCAGATVTVIDCAGATVSVIDRAGAAVTVIDCAGAAEAMRYGHVAGR